MCTQFFRCLVVTGSETREKKNTRKHHKTRNAKVWFAMMMLFINWNRIICVSCSVHLIYHKSHSIITMPCILLGICLYYIRSIRCLACLLAFFDAQKGLTWRVTDSAIFIYTPSSRYTYTVDPLKLSLMHWWIIICLFANWNSYFVRETYAFCNLMQSFALIKWGISHDSRVWCGIKIMVFYWCHRQIWLKGQFFRHNDGYIKCKFNILANKSDVFGWCHCFVQANFRYLILWWDWGSWRWASHPFFLLFISTFGVLLSLLHPSTTTHINVMYFHLIHVILQTFIRRTHR